MHIHNGYENISIDYPVVTLGIFDGMHLGHRFLIDRLIARSREMHGESVVITFNPHPRLVLEKNHKGLRFLTTFDEKISLLEKTGTDHLVVIPFTPEFSRITACDFMNNILLSKLHSRHIVLGHDHHFGRGGDGNYDTIRTCASKAGITVEQVDVFQSGNMQISSSIIRELLQSGKTKDANTLLGYNYSVKGKVVEGKKLGRKIGFPTANIVPYDSHKLIPASGVYAVKVNFKGLIYKGVLSIGTNPTVDQHNNISSTEVNIFDFDRDIYGEELEVIFISRLRDEKKFHDLDELAGQIAADKEKAISVLS